MRTCTSLPRVPRAESPPRPLRRRAALLSSGPRSSSGRGTPRRGAGCSEQRLSEAATRSGGRATAPGGPGAGAHPSPSPSMAGGSGDDRPREGRRPKAHLSKSLRPPPGGTEPAWRPRAAASGGAAAGRESAGGASLASNWRATGAGAGPPPRGAAPSGRCPRRPGSPPAARLALPSPRGVDCPEPTRPPDPHLTERARNELRNSKGNSRGKSPFRGGVLPLRF